MSENSNQIHTARKILTFILALILSVTILPGGIIQPTTARAYDLSLNVSSGHVVVPSTASDVHITGTYTGSSSDVHHGIYVQPGFNGRITLDNVSVTMSKPTSPSVGFVAAMLIDSSTLDNSSIDTKVELILVGSNTLYTGNNSGITRRAGLELMRGAQVDIKTADGTDTSGSLTAQASNQRASDDSSGGAGIGTGDVPYSGGNIIISSGTVTGNASYHGAGIGDAWGAHMLPSGSWLTDYQAHQASTNGKNGQAFTTDGGQANNANVIWLYNGTVLIYGGDVTSNGGAHGSGIGGACYAGTTNGQSTVIVLPPTKITATAGSSGSPRPLVGGAKETVYFGDTSQPAITVQVFDGSANVQSANIYADLSNIDIVNNAINNLVNNTSVLNPEKVFVGSTTSTGDFLHPNGSVGDCQFNAILAKPVTFFTDETTPNGLNYLSTTGTVPATNTTTFPGTETFILQLPYLPDMGSGLTPAQTLTFGYTSAERDTASAKLTFTNSGSGGSYADLKIPDNVSLTFTNDAAASFVADPPITITSPSSIRAGVIPTTLSGLISSGYIYKGEGINIQFPLNTGKVAGTYNAVFTIKGQDEIQGQTVTQNYNISQTVIDSGVTSVTVSPGRHTSSGGTSIITIKGTELIKAVNNGLQLQWTTNGSGPSGTIALSSPTFTGGTGVLSGALVGTITDTEIQLSVVLDAQTYYETYRDDDYTFEAYVINPATGIGYIPTGRSGMVYVGDSIPVYVSAAASPDTLPSNGGTSTITVNGHYLSNYSTIDVYDVVNGLWYRNISVSGDDRTSTVSVRVPALEGAYAFEIHIPDEPSGEPIDTVYIAVGGATLPAPGTPATPPDALTDVPGPTNPSDKEWTGRGGGHKGFGFTGGYNGVDFIHHHAKEAYLANPGNAVVTLQNVWYITELQLGHAAWGANEASKWKGGRVDIHFDTLETDGSNTLEGRLIIDPRDAAADVYPVVCTCPSETAHTRSLFAGRYPGSKLAVVCLTQNGTYGTKVEIMANVDLSGMNTKTLYLYQYDRETGKYSYMNNSNYSIDSDGLLHFFTEYGGDIIVTDSPLTTSGTAVTTGSFPVDRKAEE